MRIAVLGTGSVGRTLAGAFNQLGHDVVVGTRDPGSTAARAGEGGQGLVFGEWQAANPLEALGLAGAARLTGKVLMDVSNALDFTQGMPPVLNPVNTDSLGERIQRAFPGARVVKTLNTINARLMVNPAGLAGGGHSVFVSGDDASAKAVVTGLLEELGHLDIIDLGDITTARGAEMLMPLWLRLYAALGTVDFNIKVVRTVE
jgi:predicted dinucleotide-binding enzyme